MDVFDLLVVGAGPAGLSAAAVVAGYGGRVLVIDESPRAGGRLLAQVHPELKITRHMQWHAGSDRARTLSENASAAGAKILCGMSVWGLWPGWFVGTTLADPSQKGKETPIGFQSKAVLIATGASQNPMPLEGWTLPGVITAGAAQTLLNSYRVLPGRSVVVIGIDPLSLVTAWLLSACGADVKGIILPPDGYSTALCSPAAVLRNLAQAVGCLPLRGCHWLGRMIACAAPLAARSFPHEGIRINGCRLLVRHKAEGVRGDGRVQEIRVVTLNAKGEPVAGSEMAWQVDAVITSAGLHPLAELAQAAGCPLLYSAPLGGWVPLHSLAMETPQAGLFVAGSITGVEGAAVAEAQGRLAGLTAARHLQLAGAKRLDKLVEDAKSEVEHARKSAFPFFPDVMAGRAQMAAAWLHYS